MTVAKLATRYYVHADSYYRHPDGEPTRTAINIRHAVDPLVDLYGDSLAQDIGPVELKVVRQAMIDAKLARRTINDRISRIRTMYRWASENGLVEDGAWQRQGHLAALVRHRSKACEPEPRQPAPISSIYATLPLLHGQMRRMVKVLAMTGMRVDELCRMQWQHINRSGEIWWYTPTRHKTSHHGKTKSIPLGPRVQALLGSPSMGYIFRPIRTNGTVGERFKTSVVVYNIRRVCAANGIPHWSPGQLRRNHAQWVREMFNVETAAAMLGHSKVETTQIYAESSRDRAGRVAKEIG
ncbi:MAG: site-specific integrase [Planctomycetota bacterium]